MSLIELKPGAKADALCLERAKHAVKRGLEDNYAPFLKKLEQWHFAIAPEDYELLFKEMDKFRILCSNHVGELGDNKLNETIAQEVKNTYLKPHAELQPWLKEKFFPGQIIIITKNDPVLGLVNGNVGFCAFVATEEDLEKRRKEAEQKASPSKARRLSKVSKPSRAPSLSKVPKPSRARMLNQAKSGFCVSLSQWAQKSATASRFSRSMSSVPCF